LVTSKNSFALDSENALAIVASAKTKVSLNYVKVTKL
jgi:hypothetical protein